MSHENGDREDNVNAEKRISIQRFEDLPLSHGQSANAKRYSGVSRENTDSEKLWFGKIITGPGEFSEPHHHAEAETGGHVFKGSAYVRWGEHMENIIYVREGDFVYVPPFVPHIEGNLSRSEDVVWLTARTPDNIVVNLPNQVISEIDIKYVD
jgi:uncharacterized RmlC-like cupin family protein